MILVSFTYKVDYTVDLIRASGDAGLDDCALLWLVGVWVMAAG